MKNLFVLLFTIALSASIYAQQSGPQISWKTTLHDFGEIKEEDGIQTAKFEFINTGNEALYITNVKPSCGCTATDFSKEPVKSGATGYVTASFNPTNQRGKISKSVTVTTNEFQPTSVIRITGVVIPKQKPEEVADEEKK